jgi:hypothetical protein
VPVGAGSGRKGAPKVAPSATRRLPPGPLRATFFHPARNVIRKKTRFSYVCGIKWPIDPYPQHLNPYSGLQSPNPGLPFLMEQPGDCPNNQGDDLEKSNFSKGK